MKAAMAVDESYPEERMSGHVLREARERGVGEALRAAASFFHANAREDPDVAEYMEEVAREAEEIDTVAEVRERDSATPQIAGCNRTRLDRKATPRRGLQRRLPRRYPSPLRLLHCPPTPHLPHHFLLPRPHGPCPLPLPHRCYRDSRRPCHTLPRHLFAHWPPQPSILPCLPFHPPHRQGRL